MSAQQQRPGLLRKSQSYRHSSTSNTSRSDRENSGSRTRSSSSDRLGHLAENGDAQGKRHHSSTHLAAQAGGGYHLVHSRTHIAGHKHPNRNSSHGKHLSRLAKLATIDPAAVVAATAAAQKELHHKRTRSHDPLLQLGSKDRAVARSSSDLQKAAERKAAAEKGYSSDEVGQLEVEDSTDESSDGTMPVLNTSRKSSSRALNNGASQSVNTEPTKQAKETPSRGGFDLETEDAEAGWTETSESQSPADSRMATKPHSPSASQSGWGSASHAGPGGVDKAVTEAFERQKQKEAATTAAKAGNTGRSGTPEHHSRAGSGSRKLSAMGLLPSGNPPNLEPKLSNVSVVSAGGQTIGSSAMSGSTALHTPSMDSVSKFISGGGASTGPSRETSRIGMKDMVTPGGSLRKPNHQANLSEGGTSIGRVRPNVSFATPTNPPSSKGSNGLSSTYSQPQIPSRTQQKLWLQRASSNMEPKPIPASAFNGMASLRSTGSNLSIGIGGHGMGGHGIGVDGKDPRLQREIDRTAREYVITFKYRKPTVDSPFTQSSTSSNSTATSGGMLGRAHKSTTALTHRANGNPSGTTSKGLEQQALLSQSSQQQHHLSQSQQSQLQDPPADIEVTQDGRRLQGASGHSNQHSHHHQHKTRSSLDRFESDDRDSPSVMRSSSKAETSANSIDRLLQRYWDRVEIMGTD